MYSFFVLGLIPGTGIQITFQIWMDCLLLVFEFAAVAWLCRRHNLQLNRYLPERMQQTVQLYVSIARVQLNELKTYLINKTLSELAEF